MMITTTYRIDFTARNTGHVVSVSLKTDVPDHVAMQTKVKALQALLGTHYLVEGVITTTITAPEQD